MDAPASSTWNSIYAPLAYFLHDVCENASVFFLALDPFFWRVQFFGLYGEPKPNAAEWMREQTAHFKTGSRIKWNHKRLLNVVKSLAEKQDPPWLYSAATHILASDSPMLGHRRKRQDSDGDSNWVLDSDAAKPLRRFQDALSFVSEFQLDLGKLNAEVLARGELAYEKVPGNVPVLAASNYADRPDLITDDDVDTFLAEYLYSLGRLTWPQDWKKSTGATFYLLPLRGLGQWRATANWIYFSHSGRTKRLSPLTAITKPAQKSLEEVYTISILSTFRDLLWVACCLRPDEERHTQIFKAFAHLWWAEEINFYRAEELVHCLKRDGRDGELRQSEVSAATNLGHLGEYLLAVSRCNDPMEHNIIRIKVSPRILGQKHADTLRQTFGFDRVEYRLRMFESVENEQSRFEERLKRELVGLATSLAEADQRAKLGKYIVLANYGHTISHRTDALVEFFLNREESIEKCHAIALNDLGRLWQLYAGVLTRDELDDLARNQGRLGLRREQFLQVPSGNSYDLGKKVREWASLVVNPRKGSTPVTLELDYPHGVRLLICPYLPNSQILGEYFYRELFFELFLNVVRHGIAQESRVSLHIGIESYKGNPVLILRNPVESSRSVRLFKGWRPVLSGPSGPGLCVGLMENLALGKMAINLGTDKESTDIYWYNVQLSLEGLSVRDS